MRINLQGGSCLGVLQPVTSLVSTLSLLKPHHQNQLLSKLVNPPMDSELNRTHIVSVPLNSKRQLPARTAAEVVQVYPQDILEQEDCTRHSAASGNWPEKSKLGVSNDRCGEMVTISREGNEIYSEQEKEDFITSGASDCELYTSLHLLFRTKSARGKCTCRSWH